MTAFDFSPIKDAINTILGKPDSLVNQQPAMNPDFEQELMAGIDPAAMKRKAIGNALIAASKTLGSAPGSFLTGLGQAAPSGAEAYTTTRDANDLRRQKTLGYISDTKRKAGDDTLDRLKQLIDMGGDINREERAQQKQTNEQAEAERAIEKHQIDLATDEADLQMKFNEAVNERAKALGLDDPDFMGPERDAALKRLNDFSVKLQAELDRLVKKHGINKKNAPAGGGSILPGDAEKGITNRLVKDGVRYMKVNGRWAIDQGPAGR
jgi:hypothetical protein